MMPRIYIRDQNDEVLDTLDEGQYFDDNMQRFLKGKATVLSFTIVKTEDSYALMTAGRNLSFRFDEEDFWLSCVIVEQDETYLTVTAWSLGLELNNETHGPYKAPKAMTFAEYLAVIDIERILTIGINEVADKKISHEWEGTESKLARLYSLATVFGAELAFDTELNEDGSLKQITLNVYREHTDTDQGLGQDRRNDTFYFGEDIKTIRKTEDTSDLYTAIFATGKDGLTIAGIEKEVFDEDGNLLFATYKTQKPGFGDPRKLYAPQARDQFPSNTTGGDCWTLNTAGEFEYESAEALLGYMMSELKKNCQPATTWEIEGYIKAKIGDTVRIADEGYKPTLFLEARVIEQEISFSDKTKNKSTFSNVVELESQVDSSLLDQVQKLIDANKTYQYSISTDNGIVFKNNTGVTTLTATVRDGVADVTANFGIAWFKDGVAVGSGISITVQATEVVEKAVYRFEASRDGNVVGGYEVTVSDVSDGEAGQTPVVHPAWSWSPDGTDRFTDSYPGENLFTMDMIYPTP
ncbi:phage tail protein, partial [Enterococcus asini]|uniref:phage tail protein n=1 Tax=Enterococcus asini TaxID=57732 RepID=UPI001E397522